jgi:hypothetical protein
MGEFQAANGAPFSEVQHILRIHDTGPFTTIILPYRKNEAPTRTVTRQSCGVQIVQGPETSCFSDSSAIYTNGNTSVLTVFDGSNQEAYGIRASGGSQEVTVQPAQVVWTISGGQSGTRTLVLPGSWTSSQNVPHSGNIYTYNYTGGLQAAQVTIVFRRAG